MSFYKTMLCHFFDVNHLCLDLLDLCEELNEQITLNFILDVLSELEDDEIKNYCLSCGMNDEQIKVCMMDIRNGV